MNKKIILLISFLLIIINFSPLVFLYARDKKNNSCRIIIYYYIDWEKQRALFNAWKDDGNWPDTTEINSIFISFKGDPTKIQGIKWPKSDALHEFWQNLFEGCDSSHNTSLIYTLQDSIKFGKYGIFGQHSWSQLLLLLQKTPDVSFSLTKTTIIEFFSYQLVFGGMRSFSQNAGETSSRLAGKKQTSLLEIFAIEPEKPKTWNNLFLALPKITVKVKDELPITIENNSDLHFKIIFENEGTTNLDSLKFYYQIEGRKKRLLKSQKTYSKNKKDEIPFKISNKQLIKNVDSVQINLQYSPDPQIYTPPPIFISYEKHFTTWFNIITKIKRHLIMAMLISFIIIAILISIIIKPIRQKVYGTLANLKGRRANKTEASTTPQGASTDDDRQKYIAFLNEMKHELRDELKHSLQNQIEQYFKKFEKELSVLIELATSKTYNKVISLFNEFDGSLKQISNDTPIRDIPDVIEAHKKFLNNLRDIVKYVFKIIETTVDVLSREKDRLRYNLEELRQFVINEKFINILIGKSKDETKDGILRKVDEETKHQVTRIKAKHEHSNEENTRNADYPFENNEIKRDGASYMDVIKRKANDLEQYYNDLSSIYQINTTYKVIERFFNLLRNHDVIQAILKDNEVLDLFDLNNYTLENGRVQKVNTSLTKLVRTLQRVEPRVPDYIKIFEQKIKLAYKFWKHKENEVKLKNIRLLIHPEEILGTYNDRTNLLRNLEIDSSTRITKELFVDNIIIGFYRPLYQEILRNKFYIQLKALLASKQTEDLHRITELQIFYSTLSNILQAGAIACGIVFHEINPGDLVNKVLHNSLPSSTYFDMKPELKNELLKFENIWDSSRIMWVDTNGYITYKENGEKEIVRSNVLTYKKEFLS